jgi:hypothetical protein
MLCIGCSRVTPEVSLVAEPVATASAVDVAATVTATCGPAPSSRGRNPGNMRPPAPRPTQTRLRDAFPPVAALHSASQVIITRNWSGYSPTSPTSALYTVAWTGDAFTGDVHFEVARGRPNPKEQTLPVAIPTALMEQVLTELSSVKVSPGPYKPWIDWTDSYPDNMVRVKFGGQEVVFHSKSQGEGSVPWGIDFARQTVVAESDDIAVAFKRLEPCLHLDTFQQMIQEAANESRSQGR